MKKELQEMAERAGIETDLWDMGAASLGHVGDIQGIPRENLEAFAKLVAADCVKLADDVDPWDIADAIRTKYNL